MLFKTFLFTLAALTASAQTKNKDNGAEIEATWKAQSTFLYETRFMMSKVVSAMVGKVPTELADRVRFAKEVNAGQVSPEFKASMSQLGKDIRGIEVTSPLADFQKINNVVNTERIPPKWFGVNPPTPASTPTESVTPELLYQKEKRGIRNIDSLKEAFWAEPSKTGVRVCSFQGGNEGRAVCYDVSPEGKIQYVSGGTIGIKLELFLPKPEQKINVRSGHDILIERASYLEPDSTKPSRLRLKTLIDVMTAQSKHRNLSPEEGKELTELQAVMLKHFPYMMKK